jgi:hypothetical protein
MHEVGVVFRTRPPIGSLQRKKMIPVNVRCDREVIATTLECQKRLEHSLRRSSSVRLRPPRTGGEVDSLISFFLADRIDLSTSKGQAPYLSSGPSGRYARSAVKERRRNSVISH